MRFLQQNWWMMMLFNILAFCSIFEYAKSSQDFTSFMCTSPGFYADKNDCRIFYLCAVDQRGLLKAFNFLCDEGTVFSKDLKVCMQPLDSRRTECIEYINEIDVDFSESKNNTSHANFQKLEEFANKNYIPLNTPTPFVRSIMNGADTVKCREEGFLADSKDCKIFYRCVSDGQNGFTKYEFRCADGSAWDQSILGCNHESAVKNCRPIQGLTTTITKTNTSSSQSFSSSSSNSSSVSATVHNQITSTSTVSQASNQNIQNGSNSFTSSSVSNSQSQNSKKNSSSHNLSSVSSSDQNQQNSSHQTSSLQINSQQSASQQNIAHQNNNQQTSSKQPSSQQSSSQQGGNQQTSSHQTNKQQSSSQQTSNQQISSHQDGSQPNCSQQNNNQQNSSQLTSNNQSSSQQSASEQTSSLQSNQQSGYQQGNSLQTDGQHNNSEQNVNQQTSSQQTNNQQTSFQQSVDQQENAQQSHNQQSGNQQNSSQQTSNQQSSQEASSQQTSNQQNNNMQSLTSNQGSHQFGNQQSSHSGNRCEKEGFMGDTKDCRKFYRCVFNGQRSFTRYEFNCGEGTVWDDSTQTCNYHLSTNNSTCKTNHPSTEHTGKPNQPQHPGTPAQPGQSEQFNQPGKPNQSGQSGHSEQPGQSGQALNLGKPSQTAQSSLLAQPGQPSHPEQSGEKIQSNQPSQSEQTTQPNQPEQSAQPGYPEQSEKPGQAATPNQNNYTNQNPMPCTNASTTFTISPPQHAGANGQCEREGFMGDESDCQKFYRCVNNEKGGLNRFEFKCGEQTIWDDSIQGCNHPWAVYRSACQNQTASSLQSTSNPLYTSSKPVESSITLTPQTTISSLSSQPSSLSSLLNSIGSTSVLLPTQEPSHPVGAVCKSEGFMADPDDCTKFYRCQSNNQGAYIRHEFRCAEGTAWEEINQTCNYKTSVPRCETTNHHTSVAMETSAQISTEIVSTVTGETTTLPTTISQPLGSSTNIIYTTAMSSEAEHATNSSTSLIPNNPPGQKCSQEGYMSDPNNCKKFYRCVNSGNGQISRFDFLCGHGTAWDENQQTCNHENLVYRCSGQKNTTFSSEVSTIGTTAVTRPGTSLQLPSTSPPSTESTTTLAENTIPSQPFVTAQLTTPGGTTALSESTTIQQSTTTSPKMNVTCSSEGFHPHPNECSKYYHCVKQNDTNQYTIYHFSCPSGKVWNSSVDTCNYPDAVGGKCLLSTTTSDSYPISTTQSIASASTISTSQLLQLSTITNVETTTLTTNETSQSSTTTSLSTGVCNQGCPPVSNNQHLFVCPTAFRRHPGRCNLFYQCSGSMNHYDLSIVTFSCPNGTVYNEQKTLCESPKANENCQTYSFRFFDDELKYKNVIEVDSKLPLCSGEGHFPLNGASCGPAFIKCSRSLDANKIEGRIYRCPQGFHYWSVSRRCERTEKLKNCSMTRIYNESLLPVELANVEGQRNLRI